MPEIREITAERILSPTQLAPADYTINPYRGCQFGCLYCYAQWNKAARKSERRWGQYVDVKINAAELLAKELQGVDGGTVMIGSTTETYQPLEAKYNLTRAVLEKLADSAMSVILLTRSDLVVRDIDILKRIQNVLICYTLNTTDNTVIRAFEPRSPLVEQRLAALRKLHENGIPVYLHVGPCLPELTDPLKLMSAVDGIVHRVDFENLNLKMVSWTALLSVLHRHFPHLIDMYERIYRDKETFVSYWDELRQRIDAVRGQFQFDTNIRFHPFDSYFAP